jgi:hypothetical protein
MAVDFHIIQDALLPSLEVQCFDASGVFQLGGASAPKFYLSRPGNAAKINGTAATIVNAAEGTLRYDFTGTDTSLIGDWYGQFEVTINSKVCRIPSDGYISVHIHPER